MTKAEQQQERGEWDSRIADYRSSVLSAVKWCVPPVAIASTFGLAVLGAGLLFVPGSRLPAHPDTIADAKTAIRATYASRFPCIWVTRSVLWSLPMTRPLHHL